MSKLTTSSDFSKITTWEELRRWVTQFCEDVKVQINGKIDFVSNISCDIIDVEFTAANTDVQVNHRLRRIPTGYFLVKTNVAAIIYDGSEASTDTMIMLKSSAIANCKIVVF